MDDKDRLMSSLSMPCTDTEKPPIYSRWAAVVVQSGAGWGRIPYFLRRTRRWMLLPRRTNLSS